jgi:predicted transcriptional regulator
MSERITIRLDDAVYDRLIEASRQGAMDVSAFVRQALIAVLEKASDTSDPVPPHHPEDCLAVVVSHASPRAQRHLSAVFARLDGILTRQGRSRLWFAAETLAHWAAKAELRVYEASVRGSGGGSDA